MATTPVKCAADGCGHRYPPAIVTPVPFLEVLVHELEVDPSLTALCVCYESGAWRKTQFAKHLFEWLPEFALSWSERQRFADNTSVALLRRAAAAVYDSDKYQRRGEFGELILHAVIRQVFNSEPAISKIFFKDSVNDTVKGFDAVHIVDTNAALELWLGEAKLFKEVTAAIASVVDELSKHTDQDYLRREFMLITNKIDEAWPHAEALKTLLHENTSLDTVFQRVTIPVLLTYDSAVIGAHGTHSDEYVTDFIAEVKGHWDAFRSKSLPSHITIRLFLLPLESKDELVTELDAQLRLWHNI